MAPPCFFIDEQERLPTSRMMRRAPRPAWLSKVTMPSGILVRAERFELPFAASETAVLPIGRSPSAVGLPGNDPGPSA